MRSFPRRFLLSILAFTLWSTLVYADGGRVQFQNIAGSFIITLFTAPTPLRAGPVDFSILIQNRETKEPLLDASVRLSLRDATGMTVSAEPTREQAKNKLLYAATMNMPESGPWKVQVDVTRGSDSASAGGEIIVLPSRSPLLSYWEYFLIPPVAIILFALHQWLKNRSV